MRVFHDDYFESLRVPQAGQWMDRLVRSGQVRLEFRNPHFRTFFFNSVDTQEIPAKLNQFLANLFVIMFDDLKKWNDDSANFTSPQLSLFDVPHLLTPSRWLAKKIQFRFLGTSKGSSINDVTQLKKFFTPPSPIIMFLVIRLYYCRHKIIDTPPSMDMTSFMD